MVTSCSPDSIRQNRAEKAIDRAVHQVYLKYGPDLNAFFRDASNQGREPSPAPPPTKTAAVPKRKARSA